MNEMHDISSPVRLAKTSGQTPHTRAPRDGEHSSPANAFCSPTAPEARVLLACARTRMDFKSATVLRDAIDGPIDWDRVIALAGRHRIRPLLLTSLASARPGTVPKWVADNLGEFATANARRNLFLIGELSKLIELFQSNGIAAAPFKGPMLALEAYGNTAMREAGDLDLLVHRRDTLPAKRLLVSRGFRPIFPTAQARKSPIWKTLPATAKLDMSLRIPSTI